MNSRVATFNQAGASSCPPPSRGGQIGDGQFRRAPEAAARNRVRIQFFRLQLRAAAPSRPADTAAGLSTTPTRDQNWSGIPAGAVRLRGELDVARAEPTAFAPPAR